MKHIRLMIKYQMPNDIGVMWHNLDGWKDRSLKEWRKMKNSQLDRWLWKNLVNFFAETKQLLQKKLKDDKFNFSIFKYNTARLS